MKKCRCIVFLFLALNLQSLAQITDSLIAMPSNKTVSDDLLINQAIIDAKLYYKPVKSEAWKVGVTSAFVTPVLGAIPAMIYTSKLPNEEQLQYPMSEYSQSTIYRYNYLQQAQKMKRNRILKAYVAGSCVSAVVIGVGVSLFLFLTNPMPIDLGNFN